MNFVEPLAVLEKRDYEIAKIENSKRESETNRRENAHKAKLNRQLKAIQDANLTKLKAS